MNIKDVLIDLLRKSGENPNSLSKKTGVSQSTIQRAIAAETKEPRRSTLEPIAKHFKVPVEDFYKGKPIVLPTIDNALLQGGDVVVWNKPEDLEPSEDRVWIDQWDYNFSAGDGKINWEIRQKDALPFNAAFFTELGVKPQNAKLVSVVGNSMEPKLYDGDLMMIDISQTEVRDGRTYAVYFEGDALVKQIFKQSGGVLILKSANPDYMDKTVIPGDDVDFKVVGRVVYKSGKSGF